MTPSNRAKLLQAERDYYQANYPSVPGHGLARTAYKDNSSNALTKCVIDYIRYTGGMAERVNTMGRQIKAKSGRDIWIRGGGTNGSSDIHATIRGRTVAIEIKFGHDRIRPDQVRYAERITRAGGLYYICRSFDEFVTWYETIVNN